MGQESVYIVIVLVLMQAVVEVVNDLSVEVV